MLRQLIPRPGRKLNLFFAACFRRYWSDLPLRIRSCVELIEACAEGSEGNDAVEGGWRTFESESGWVEVMEACAEVIEGNVAVEDGWRTFESELAALYEASYGAIKGRWLALAEIISAGWSREVCGPEYPRKVESGRVKERKRQADL